MSFEGKPELLRPEEIERIERDYAAGLPARVIVDVFASRGVPVSEATFRKYVQAGLLPRSRRVGRKGKHRGSQGLYPASSVRRMNAIRQMMAQGLTLEDIKASFVVYRNHLDVAGHELNQVFDGYERHLEGLADTQNAARQKELTSQLRSLRFQARALLHEITRFGSSITARTAHDLK
ncbi:MAG: MerR family transcriptional regulator [Myxococcaceae bacterium]